MEAKNEDVAELLQSIGELLSLSGDSPNRARAYGEAARAIRALGEDVATLRREGRLSEIRGVGESIAAKIGEYLDTGRSSYYEQLKRRVPVAETGLLEVAGVGPARARDIYERLGITSAADLAQAAREHRLSDVPGIGPALEERIGREAERAAQRGRRLLLDAALTAAEAIVSQLRASPAVERIDPAGSLRRMQETIGDIDLLVSSSRPEDVQRIFTSL